MHQAPGTSASESFLGLRLWQRLSVRLTCLQAQVPGAGAPEGEVAVSLPMTCKVIDGKVVRPMGKAQAGRTPIHMTPTSDSDALRLEARLP